MLGFNVSCEDTMPEVAILEEHKPVVSHVQNFRHELHEIFLATKGARVGAFGCKGVGMACGQRYEEFVDMQRSECKGDTQ
jgi:hypothetical protein